MFDATIALYKALITSFPNTGDPLDENEDEDPLRKLTNDNWDLYKACTGNQPSPSIETDLRITCIRVLVDDR